MSSQHTTKVLSCHGTYECDAQGHVLQEKLDPGGNHKSGERVRFEWPDDVVDEVDILACVEYHANGDVIPADEDYLRDVYYA